MKNKYIIRVALIAALLSVGQLTAAPTFNVVPASAPNGFGSPSYSTWVDNTINALYTGSTTYGNLALPSYYSQAPSSMDVSQNIVTGFPSWQGQADPGTVFGPAYASELGNRLAFGFVLNGNGSQVSIDQLGFSMISTDTGNTLNYGFGVGTYSYSASYRGLLFGGNGVIGGGDDSWVTSGASNQLVDAIIGRGSGNAWAVYDSNLGATRQVKIDNAVTSVLAGSGPGGFDFTGTYTYGTAVTGSGTVHFNSVGVPDGGSTASMFVFAMLGLVTVSRRFC